MSKHKVTTIPTLKFGGSRSGSLAISAAARQRVAIKGDWTCSPHEASVFVSQLQWWLAQAALHASTPPPASGRPATTASTKATLDRSDNQLPLPYDGSAHAAVGSVSGKS
jgi:hypothetical protein